jgi:hypothetical protein
MINQERTEGGRSQAGESSIDYAGLLNEARAKTRGEADPVLEKARKQERHAAETLDFVAIELGPSTELARALADMHRMTANRLLVQGRNGSEEDRESAERIGRVRFSQ